MKSSLDWGLVSRMVAKKLHCVCALSDSAEPDQAQPCHGMRLLSLVQTLELAACCATSSELGAAFPYHLVDVVNINP